MKSYTDLEQSKKLAEILPIESADHHYVRTVQDSMGKPVDGKWSVPKYGNPNSSHANYIVMGFTNYETIPCWSLAALIELMPNEIKGHDLAMYKSYCYNDKGFVYSVYYEGGSIDYEQSILFSTFSMEVIDACYEMIIKLHEQKML